MKKQRIIAALTAAVTALSSAAAFPAAAFAAEQQGAYSSELPFSDTVKSNAEGIDSIDVSGTEKCSFDDAYIATGSHTVGYDYFDEDYGVGYWVDNKDEILEGITTIDKLVSKYGSLELKFGAANIVGDLEVYGVLEVKGTNDDEWQQICLPAQDVTEGQNVYAVDFPDSVDVQYHTLNSVHVRFHAKEHGKSASFDLYHYDAKLISATGTETFKSGIDADEDLTVSIEQPEWWNPEWGPLFIADAGSWYYGMDEGVNTCPVNTIPELYITYKGGEITFNVSNLSADVTYNVVLQTRAGDEYGEEFVLSDNNTLKNGENTVKFDLPNIMYLNPDIWGITLGFSADEATEFTINNPKASEPTASEPETSEPTASEPETSEPTASEPETSEPTASEPTTSDTNEVFKTEEKPIKDIMEEVKPDTTASIEVAPADTTIKADVFEAAKEKKVTLKLKLENGVKWEIKSETIGSGAAEVNINVELNTSNIPAANVDAVADGKSTMQISLAHNGSFGFEADITIPVAPANNGKVANLFHFNNGALEFVASVTVSNGEATLPFSHASEYVIVFDEKSMGAPESTSVPATDKDQPNTGAAGIGVCAALAAVSAAAVIVCRKNKNN